MYKLILLLLLAQPLAAKPRAEHLSLELSRLPYTRDYFFPNQHYWQYELQLRWDVSWGRWFMDNNIRGRTYNSRFRYVGWEYETGFRIFPGFDIVWHHHSQHALDLERSKYPVLDAYGIRITFIDSRG